MAHCRRRTGNLGKGRRLFGTVHLRPFGLFPRYLATPDANIFTTVPLNYFKTFHRDHNPDVEQLVADEGASDWAELFATKGGLGATNETAWWQNPEIPTLLAWRITTSLTGGERLVADRNPYYWKTDPDGRQLPYLDQVIVEIIAEPPVAVLRASRGEFSLLQDEYMTLRDKPVLARSEEEGGYHVIDVVLSSMNNAIVMFNLNHEDPELRAVFQNKDFRVGMSHAINRQEIINTVLQRQGEPWQTSPLEQSSFFDERMAKQFTEHDPALANEHLDRAGFTDRDGDGFRLRADGNRISFTLAVRGDSIATWPDTAELLNNYWREVGIDSRIRVQPGIRVFDQVDLNGHDAIMDDGYPGLNGVLLDPIWYFPSHGGCQYAGLWGEWYESGGESGMEPPAATRRQMELYDQVRAEVDPARQEELFTEVLQIARDEFYVIGIALPGTGYSVVQNALRNVPREMLGSGGQVPTPGFTRPEQFYWSAES